MSWETILRAWDGETVVTHFDRPTGAWILIAVHSTRRGPARSSRRTPSSPRPSGPSVSSAGTRRSRRRARSSRGRDPGELRQRQKRSAVFGRQHVLLNDAGAHQVEHRVQIAAGERGALGRSLHLHEPTRGSHDDVEVDLRRGILRVVEIQIPFVADHATGNRGDAVGDRVLLERALLL